MITEKYKEKEIKILEDLKKSFGEKEIGNLPITMTKDDVLVTSVGKNIIGFDFEHNELFICVSVDEHPMFCTLLGLNLKSLFGEYEIFIDECFTINSKGEKIIGDEADEYFYEKIKKKAIADYVNEKRNDYYFNESLKSENGYIC